MFIKSRGKQQDWIISPFTESDTQHLASELIRALDDLSSDHSLKIVFDNKKTLAEFWISVEKEYPQLSAAAMDVLLPFATTYFCEKTFSTLLYIKTKYRSRSNVKEDLRIAVSKIKPRLELLYSKH